MKYAVIAVAGILLVSCGEHPAGTPALTPGGSNLASVEILSDRVARETSFDGVVEALNQSTVSAQTSARVIELPYDVGDFVEKGAIIVRLRDTEQRARASSAEAALAEAEARLTEAQQAYDRTRDIYEQKLIPKAQFDTAAADLKSAQARVEAARATSREAQEGAEHTVVRAPYSGIVVKRNVKLGETVTVGSPLMTGLSLEHLRVAVDIPQQHISTLRKHRKARVLLPEGRSVNATEVRIPPAADPDTHTFRVLVTLPQYDHGVFPGTLVKVAFVSGEQEQLLVPASAVVQRGEVIAVYVIDQTGLINFRYLRIGNPLSDGRLPILSGLIAGERVATDPMAAGIAYKQQNGNTGG
jgi:RND family efflux transporter MFP subunit